MAKENDEEVDHRFNGLRDRVLAIEAAWVGEQADEPEPTGLGEFP